MTGASAGYKSNLILDALMPEEYERLATHLEYVDLPIGKVLYDLEAPIKYAYFPLQGAVSIVTVLKDGGSVEVGIVGNEGVVGVPLILGTEAAVNRRAQVQIPGRAACVYQKRQAISALLSHMLPLA